MNALETYLKRATRGLWGQSKRDTTLELRGSIEARVWALEHQGIPQDQALETALRELGDARAVNAGMQKVHLVPQALRGTVLAAVFASVGLIGLQNTQAQVQVARPAMTAWLDTPEPERPVYLSLDDLKANLERAGIAVTESMQPPRSDRWPAQTVTGEPKPPPVSATRTLGFQLPESPAEVQLQALPGWSITETGQTAKFEPGTNVYVSAHYVMQVLLEARLPVRVEGWLNPTLRVGQTAIRLGTARAPTKADFLFSSALNSYYFEARNAQGLKLPGALLAGTCNRCPAHRHAIRLDTKPGTVYGLLTTQAQARAFQELAYSEGDFSGSLTFSGLARVNDQGVLQFSVPWKGIEFAQSLKALEPDQRALEAAGFDAANAGIGTTTRPAKVVLVRLTGRLDSLEWQNGQDPRGVVEVPARSRSWALR